MTETTSKKRQRQVLVAMAWMALGGLTLAAMNAVMRVMTIQMEPLQAQFLRYVFGLIAMLPVIFRGPLHRFRTVNIRGHFWRGVTHTAALCLFFLALPHLPLADMTAIMFTSPIFVLIGAALFLGEKVTLARWLTACVGFSGVIIVVWPHFADASGAGWWSVVMLGASPLFAAGFLIAKSLTRNESASSIVVWLSVTVSLFTLPFAIAVWHAPTITQWCFLAGCGVLGTVAHACFTHALSMADISAVQPMRFLDLIWSSILGLMIFGNSPSLAAIAGGTVILGSTLWIARHESRARTRIVE